MAELTNAQVREAVTEWLWARRTGDSAEMWADEEAFDRWLDGVRHADWEYGICYVDTFTGRQSFERNYAGDGRSREQAEKVLAERRAGNPLWSQSTIARRIRTEWEAIS